MADATTEAVAADVVVEEKQDCPVDESGDLEDPNNLFTCLASEECCTVDLLPACCQTKETKDEVIDQLKLWGPLLGIILALALFIWWCRSDESCCDVEKPWLYRCGCKKRPEEDEEDLTGSQVSIRSSKSATTILVTDDGVEGHDAEELEEAADNLEAVLEDGEGNEGGDDAEDGEEEDEDEEDEDEEEEDEEDEEEEDDKEEV